MLKEKEIPLKIEVFRPGEDVDFLLHSPAEISNILKTISARNTRSAIYFEQGKSFFLTMLLAVNNDGVWIDPAARSLDNQRLLESDEIIFVSSHNNTKVQFVANEARLAPYAERNALFVPLPQKLLRLQRRDYFRLAANPQHPLKCVIHPERNPLHIKHEVSVVDISIGGLSLICPEKELRFFPGNIYPNCEINLPEIGTLTATLEVKNTFEIPGRHGKSNRRAGCVFVKPDRETTLPLQRYVSQMQCQRA